MQCQLSTCIARNKNDWTATVHRKCSRYNCFLSLLHIYFIFFFSLFPISFSRNIYYISSLCYGLCQSVRFGKCARCSSYYRKWHRTYIYACTSALSSFDGILSLAGARSRKEIADDVERNVKCICVRCNNKKRQQYSMHLSPVHFFPPSRQKFEQRAQRNGMREEKGIKSETPRGKKIDTLFCSKLAKDIHVVVLVLCSYFCLNVT